MIFFTFRIIIIKLGINSSFLLQVITFQLSEQQQQHWKPQEHKQRQQQQRQKQQTQQQQQQCHGFIPFVNAFATIYKRQSVGVGVCCCRAKHCHRQGHWH